MKRKLCAFTISVASDEYYRMGFGYMAGKSHMTRLLCLSGLSAAALSSAHTFNIYCYTMIMQICISRRHIIDSDTIYLLHGMRLSRLNTLCCWETNLYIENARNNCLRILFIIRNQFNPGHRAYLFLFIWTLEDVRI